MIAPWTGSSLERHFSPFFSQKWATRPSLQRSRRQARDHAGWCSSPPRSRWWARPRSRSRSEKACRASSRRSGSAAQRGPCSSSSACSICGDRNPPDALTEPRRYARSGANWSGINEPRTWRAPRGNATSPVRQRPLTASWPSAGLDKAGLARERPVDIELTARCGRRHTRRAQQCTC